jgi:hypothetical protein
MAVINNITQIPAPRVDVIDSRTGLMSREWYRFFLNLFTLTGAGTSSITAEELSYSPTGPQVDEIYNIINSLELGPVNQPNVGGSGSVTQVNTGTGLTGGPIVTTGTISIDSTVVTLTGTQTLTNKTITGLNSGSTVQDSAGNLYEFGFRTMPQSNNTSGTLVLSDSAKHLYLTGNVTVPPNSSVAFEIGTVISVVSNATALVIQAGSGVTLKLANSTSTGNRSVASNGVATMIKVATDTWYVFGLGVT